MDEALTSLLLIAALGFVAPVISFLIPHRLIPEVFLLLIAGMVIGPYGLGLAHVAEPLHLLSELGLGFLFLLAGYEINPAEVGGKVGRGAFFAWLAAFCGGLLAVKLALPEASGSMEGAAVAIAMSATALGTLLPIIKDRGLTDTPAGAAILAHGAMGEIGPIVMMALLLSFSNTWYSIGILLLFALGSAILAFIPLRAQAMGSRLVKLVRFGSGTTAQTTVRAVVVLLVALITFAASLGLDVVLGAFAAGFIVRQALPEGRQELEEKLDGLAFGFFIPIFFVISGMAVDPRVALDSPLNLALFLAALLGVRGLPIFITLSFSQFSPGQERLPVRSRAKAALYCTTNLPIIVAVTQLAVSAEAMGQRSASTLVMAGSLSVLLFPLLAQIISRAPGRAKLHSWTHPGERGQSSRWVRPGWGGH